MRIGLHFISLAIGLLGCSASGFAQVPGPYKGKVENLPIEVDPQPIAFSHGVHMESRMSCADCHRNAATKERAGLPKSEDCMLCHNAIAVDHPEVQKLAAQHDQGKKIEWVRVYTVPDYVFFSHANHLAEGIKCSTCHGPVESRDVLAQEVSTSMVGCMNCHEARQAPNSCVFCHELGH